MYEMLVGNGDAHIQYEHMFVSLIDISEQNNIRGSLCTMKYIEVDKIQVWVNLIIKYNKTCIIK